MVGARAAVTQLTTALGPVDAVVALARISAAIARGEPWRELPAPVDVRDKKSRTHVGSVVVLYREMQTRMPQLDAFALARKVVLAGGTAFLDGVFPSISAAELADAATSLVENFVNAEGTIERHGKTEIDFQVSRCRFVELMNAVGTPELAPLFCEVDAAFFEAKRTITLHRPLTIAAGDDRCEFRFRAAASSS